MTPRKDSVGLSWIDDESDKSFPIEGYVKRTYSDGLVVWARKDSEDYRTTWRR